MSTMRTLKAKNNAAIFRSVVIYGSISTLVRTLSVPLGDSNAQCVTGTFCVKIVAHVSVSLVFRSFLGIWPAPAQPSLLFLLSSSSATTSKLSTSLPTHVSSPPLPTNSTFPTFPSKRELMTDALATKCPCTNL
ncbi:hypothetical protein L596_028702 [Steinernema carpocapsae]|uniref:Uncharacterized protein n=1 Tax=Steinernema carpocapsae TaxID=34508 RepID=A0A4U5LZ46_STECR|nr:hypothetical protein L596_028702 [Steinernema carpocapsae]